MSERRDKLGRRIPDFDRSAAGKKGMETQKEKYGPNHPSRIGTIGGHKRTRGHFGKLKDEGREEELKALSEKANAARKAKEAEAETQADKKSGEGGNGTSVPSGKS